MDYAKAVKELRRKLLVSQSELAKMVGGLFRDRESLGEWPF